jgi:transposase InsO family protein
VAKVFGITRKVVWYWRKRASRKNTERFFDRKRRTAERKVTPEIEMFIVTLRTVFEWGSGRIQQGLFSLPRFMYDVLPRRVSGVRLSRMTINNVLKKHKINGYKKEREYWKFFRAKKPNELWQLDIKGPVRVGGKRYWFLVCVDDYSRYLIICKQFDHYPFTVEIEECVQKSTRRRAPENILTDNGIQFRGAWKDWCRMHGIKPLFAHPFYPQDKGKVERAIRNVAEEFTNLLMKFPQWLGGQIEQFRNWYNKQRFHMGIGTVPNALYVGS